jgi:hypothetical protein
MGVQVAKMVETGKDGWDVGGAGVDVGAGVLGGTVGGVVGPRVEAPVGAVVGIADGSTVGATWQAARIMAVAIRNRTALRRSPSQSAHT